MGHTERHRRPPWVHVWHTLPVRPPLERPSRRSALLALYMCRVFFFSRQTLMPDQRSHSRTSAVTLPDARRHVAAQLPTLPIEGDSSNVADATCRSLLVRRRQRSQISGKVEEGVKSTASRCSWGR